MDGGESWGRQRKQELSACASKSHHHTHRKLGESIGRGKRIKTTLVWNSSQQAGRAADENTGSVQCEVEMFT